MWWIALAATAVGIVLGIWMPYNLTPEMSPYVAIAIVAALDTVIGGITAYMKKKFDMTIFFTGFFTNMLLAVALVYIGDMIGTNLIMIGVIVAFVIRMFQNFATMRYIILERYQARKIAKTTENLEKNEDETSAEITGNNEI